MNYHKALSAVLLSLFWMFVEAETFDDSQFAHIDYPAWFNQNPFNNLSEVLAESNATGKKGVFVLYTTEGCSYCDHFIRQALADPAIASKVQGNFESVGLEIFDDTELTTPEGTVKSVKQFAADEKVQFSPTILFYGNDGKRIFRKTGYLSPEKFDQVLNYLTEGHYKTQPFKNYISGLQTKTPVSGKIEHPESALTDNPLFAAPPYMLDRSRVAASMPLLVIFERKNCSPCKAFHADILSDKKITDSLRKFEIVRLDAEDNKTPVLAPGGKRTTPAQWYNANNFTQAPALLFFDEQGNTVLKTDALVLHQRMTNSMHYVLEGAYQRGWSYQRFARSKAIERANSKGRQAEGQ